MSWGQLTDEQRAELRATLDAKYRAGASLRSLVAEYEIHYNALRSELHAMGTPVRPRGRPRKQPR